MDVRGLGIVFDTSELPAVALRGWIRDYLSVDPSKLTLQVESFGYKHGVPLDADLVFDARCLPNPHWDPRLRPFSGQDAPVREYLDGQQSVVQYLADIRGFLDAWLPRFESEDKGYLTVAIGCTGGQHRSVYLAERLAQAFSPRYQVLVRHRGLD